MIREGHSFTLVGSEIFLFGGWSWPDWLNDLYILNTSDVLNFSGTALRLYNKQQHDEKLTLVLDSCPHASAGP